MFNSISILDPCPKTHFNMEYGQNGLYKLHLEEIFKSLYTNLYVININPFKIQHIPGRRNTAKVSLSFLMNLVRDDTFIRQVEKERV